MSRPQGTGAARPCARGIALVLTAGILVLLSLVAAAFVRLRGVGTAVSRGDMDGVRARLLAGSGVEYAAARLSRGVGVPAARTAANQPDDWRCRDRAGVPLPRSGNPSYRHRRGEPYMDLPIGGVPPNGRYDDGSDAYLDLDGNGNAEAWTGRLRGTNGLFADLFSLRIEDESAKINVNGGFLDAIDRDGDGPDHRDVAVGPDPSTAAATGRGWNAQLRRILDVLGTVREDGDGDGILDPGEDWDGDGVLDPAPLGIVDLGRKVLEARPAGGYRSVLDLQGRLGISKDLSPYLTVHSWSDPKVVHPNAHTTELVPRLAPGDVKRNRPLLALEERGRPPVNLNAAEPAVLATLIEGLAGVCWFDGCGVSGQTDVPKGWPLRYDIPRPMAARIAGEMVVRRPFATWRDFGLFCEGLVPGTIAGLNGPDLNHRFYGGGNLCGADILKANFDPNTRLNKQHADRLIWRWIDKSDLLAWSTEGALEPTGAFRIESWGRVRNVAGGHVAQGTLRAASTLFVPVRQTTQADFVGGRGNVRDYLALSTGVERTAGASASWLGGGTGVAATTYPCGPTSLPGGAAVVDGCVGLATVETAHSAPPGGTLQFLHHFDDGWDADLAAGAVVRQGGPQGQSANLQTNPAIGVWPDPSQQPGTLLPDGAHLQIGRAPAFSSVTNLPEQGRHGTIGYWVKLPVNYNVSYGFSCVRWVGPVAEDTTHSVFVGAGTPWDMMGLIPELDAQQGAIDEGHEIRLYHETDPNFRRWRPGMRWRLLTAFWDTDVPVIQDSVYAWYQGVGTVARRYDGYGVPLDPALEEALVGPGETSEIFVLGTQLRDFNGRGMADQVSDEFAICDFGDGAAAKSASQTWHDDRYAQGRYYKGNDGTYTSATLEPFPGRVGRIVSASWTGARPSDAMADLGPGDWGFWYETKVLPAAGAPRVQDATLADARLEVELLDGNGDPFVPPRMLSERGAVGLGLGRFRYRVRFLPTPSWTVAERDNRPVLESPWFDDITFLCAPPGGPRLAAWEQP